MLEIGDGVEAELQQRDQENSSEREINDERWFFEINRDGDGGMMERVRSA